MRRVISVLIALLGLLAPASKTRAFPPELAGPYGALLAKYVKTGGVDYSAWKASPEDFAALETLAGKVAAHQPGTDRAERLAFYLNAYNLWILREMLAAYPVKGPLALSPEFFKEPRPTVAGRKLSFDDLEQKIIRQEFRDPRIHFALNCASRSCPPLAREPFRPEDLDDQLDERTRAFAATREAAVLERGAVRVSKLFEWYRGDFPKGAVEFLNRYRDRPLPADAKVEFQTYDWGLNDV